MIGQTNKQNNRDYYFIYVDMISWHPTRMPCLRSFEVVIWRTQRKTLSLIKVNTEQGSHITLKRQ